MCGRYTLTVDTDALLEELAVTDPESRERLATWRPRFNVAPTDSMVIQTRPGEAQMARWGLIPFWAKDLRVGAKMINARAETVAEKPAFRDAFARRRCLVAADGYYEWRQGPGGRKTPFHLHLPDRTPFTFAGLWERYRAEGGDPIVSFTIVTTKAAPPLAELHDRMPVIVPRSERVRWLDEQAEPHALQKLLVPFEGLELQQVSPRVGKVQNDDPALLDPE